MRLVPPDTSRLFAAAAEAGLAAANFSSDAIKITTPNPKEHKANFAGETGQ